MARPELMPVVARSALVDERARQDCEPGRLVGGARRPRASCREDRKAGVRRRADSARRPTARQVANSAVPRGARASPRRTRAAPKPVQRARLRVARAEPRCDRTLMPVRLRASPRRTGTPTTAMRRQKRTNGTTAGRHSGATACRAQSGTVAKGPRYAGLHSVAGGRLERAGFRRRSVLRRRVRARGALRLLRALSTCMPGWCR